MAGHRGESEYSSAMQKSGVCSQRRPSNLACGTLWMLGLRSGGAVAFLCLRGMLRFPGVAAVIAACGCFAAAPAHAVPSDAMILVQPMGNQVVVAFVFPKVVSHSVLASRIRKLATNTGWSVASLEIQDEAVRMRGGSAAYGRPLKETGATVVFRNAPQARDGGFLLQPYLDAFADLSRIEILYMTPPFPDFRGLRDFSSPALSVRLLRAGGPYHYVAEIRDHASPLPILPITQPLQDSTSPRNRGSSSKITAEIALVFAIASAAGLAVLLGFFLRQRLKVRRKAIGRRQVSRSHLR